MDNDSAKCIKNEKNNSKFVIIDKNRKKKYTYVKEVYRSELKK